MKRWILVSTFGLCLLFGLIGKVSAEEKIPEWFKYNTAQPYKIFEAWKSLSTREAALYLGSDWNVLAGVLRDAKGKPVPLAPMGIIYNDRIRGYGATFMTDSNGYFIIYSPYTFRIKPPVRQYGKRGPTSAEIVKEMNETGCEFYASPGYPSSWQGRSFAGFKGETRVCMVKLVAKGNHRAFYSLRVNGHSSFDKAEFAKFKAKQPKNYGGEERKPWRDRPHRDGAVLARTVTKFRIRVTSASGKPIPRTIVKFWPLEGFGGSYQVVETDDRGECKVEESSAKPQQKEHYEQIKRNLTIDAPGYAVGPVNCQLKTDDVNNITLDAPATVSGTILDYAGNPFMNELKIFYKRQNTVAFETDIHPHTDGSFSFNRIMPGEEFQIIASAITWQTTPMAPVSTGPITLQPGEAKKNISLKVPLAAALRGIVVDTAGKPVIVGGDSGFLNLIWQQDTESGPVPGNRQLYVGTGFPRWGESDHRFGFFGLGTTPFKIKVDVPHYQSYLSPGMQLEPGELRFVKIVLKRKDKKVGAPVIVTRESAYYHFQ